MLRHECGSGYFGQKNQRRSWKTDRRSRNRFETSFVFFSSPSDCAPLIFHPPPPSSAPNRFLSRKTLFLKIFLFRIKWNLTFVRLKQRPRESKTRIDSIEKKKIVAQISNKFKSFLKSVFFMSVLEPLKLKNEWKGRVGAARKGQPWKKFNAK